jgi:hypothetical protein
MLWIWRAILHQVYDLLYVFMLLTKITQSTMEGAIKILSSRLAPNPATGMCLLFLGSCVNPLERTYSCTSHVFCTQRTGGVKVLQFGARSRSVCTLIDFWGNTTAKSMGTQTNKRIPSCGEQTEMLIMQWTRGYLTSVRAKDPLSSFFHPTERAAPLILIRRAFRAEFV